MESGIKVKNRKLHRMNRTLKLNRRQFLRATNQPVEICGRDATLRFDSIAHDVTTFEIEPADHNRNANLPKGYERGQTPGQPNHMVDWVNCIRSRGTPKCSTDEAFIETATFLMSLLSQQQRRVLRWDAVREEIV